MSNIPIGAADISLTLQQRKNIYGSYEDGTAFRTEVMRLIKQRYKDNSTKDMDPFYETMIWDLVNKLSRLAVSPDHFDTIHDIVGYANLYEDIVIKNMQEKRNAQSR